MIKDFPKIGIRPVIDGRRKGIRESLESQTMELAKKVANLLENELMYIDGSPVKTCISDTTIGGYAESVKCAEKFERENVGVSLTVTPCWCYGSEVMDENPLIPKAIWGFNGSERPGAVFLAAVSAAHDQKGFPAFAIYGKNVQDADDLSIPEDVKTKILKFARAALAVAFMRKKAYLSIGSVSMGIAGSVVNEDFFEKYLGMHVEYSDMSEIIRRIEEEIYDEEEYKKALDWVSKNCKEGIDINAKEKQFNREEKDKQWEFIIKMTMIIRDMMIGNPKLKEMNYGEEAEGHYAIASGFQGQRQWTDHFPNGDFSEAILNSSFDWNGIRNPFIVATENDSLNAVSMLFGYLLTNTAQIFSDVRTYWSPEAVKRVTGKSLQGKAKDGVIHLKNSGSTTLDGTGKEKDENGNSVMKPFWEITEDEMEKCLKATEWCPANVEYFRGGGFSSKFLTEGEMPATMCRINIVKGLGPVLQIAEGYTVKLDKKVNKALDERTDPSWPTTWFAPKLTGKGAFRDVYSVMNNWGANHGAISYGHIGAELIALASILRIPVSMHNVEKDRIFRPKTWAAFGTENLESADYRACKALGPLYGNY
ncbi:MAG: L-fucose isomerase [Thermotogota bacterium]|nr:L-fucose isomerase [Thermotogota bacterium]